MELWRLPHQRKISLRFLAFYLLRMEIQVIRGGQGDQGLLGSGLGMGAQRSVSLSSRLISSYPLQSNPPLRRVQCNPAP